jgi:multidrug efflux pump subunit AcrA (membrane-fusion protein)
MGNVESINGQSRDKVKKGQVLAKLENLSTLSSEVTSTKLALVTA